MPRDTPPIALPALAFEDAPEGALRYGGAPRLPEDIDWPCQPDGQPLHFLAEIDLAALPQEMEQAGARYAFPARPSKGRLFIFAPLNADMIYQYYPVVLHAAGADDTTPERDLPANLPALDPDDAHVFRREAVAADCCTLKPGAMAARAYLSARAENPLWRNMDRAEVSEDEIYARDRAYADQLNALGIDYDVPLPTPPAAREALCKEIPVGFQGYVERGLFQWDWRYIFEVAKAAYAGCHDLPVEQLEGWIEDGEDTPKIRRLIAKFKAQKSAILAQEFDGRPGLWERFSCDHIPATTMRTDVQLRRWMGYARVMHRKRDLTEEDKRAFVDFLQHVDKIAYEDGPVSLRVLALFREHRVRNFYIEQVVSAAFKDTARALQHLHPGRELETQNDYGDADREARTVQMFGAGYLMQHAAVEHEDKVLLFQISDACGVIFEDGIVQIWITHEDLARGRFDRTITTYEMT